MERAHVVQPVGELDQQDADVVRHGEQELAQILGGALVFALRLDLGELGDAVDQPGDVLAEQFLDLLGRRQRVLDRVVEDRGDDRLVVEMEVGEDAGDLDRMAVIGIARGAGLGAVRLHREDIGAVDQRLVGVGIVGPDLLDQFILRSTALRWGSARHVASAKMAGAHKRGTARRRSKERVVSWLLATAGVDAAGAEALHLARSFAAIAWPSTVKLSSWPAFLASDWQSTSGGSLGAAP